MTSQAIPPKLFSPIYHQTELQATLRRQLLDMLDASSAGASIVLARLTTFVWERVCFFGMGASHAYINKVLGINWLTGPGYVHEQRQLWVFVQGLDVVQHLLFRPEVVWGMTLDWKLGVCLSADEAVLTVEVDPAGRRMFALPNIGGMAV